LTEYDELRETPFAPVTHPSPTNAPTFLTYPHAGKNQSARSPGVGKYGK
jgi:hypothetical protein